MGVYVRHLFDGLFAYIRSTGKIVLNVALSGIASLLLPGGRTAHSRFKIPSNPHQHSTCSTNLGGQLDELIAKSSLIIWDEAPMMHKRYFEALDQTLKDIMKSIDIENGGKLFGGKTIIFGGDFRQILPLIPKGKRQDIVNATINLSYIWSGCKVIRLTQNMRLHRGSISDDSSELATFAEWIANIGDGNIGEGDDASKVVQMPDDLLIKYEGDPIEVVVKSTYPSCFDISSNLENFHEIAILALTNEVVDAINEYMISMNNATSTSYYSSDSSYNSNVPADVLSNIHMP